MEIEDHKLILDWEFLMKHVSPDVGIIYFNTNTVNTWWGIYNETIHKIEWKKVGIMADHTFGGNVYHYVFYGEDDKLLFNTIGRWSKNHISYSLDVLKDSLITDYNERIIILQNKINKLNNSYQQIKK